MPFRRGIANGSKVTRSFTYYLLLLDSWGVHVEHLRLM
jgi:hypothetical protein